MFELPKFRLFEKTRARFKPKKRMAPSRPKPKAPPRVRYWLLAFLDISIALLVRAVTWGLIIFIAGLDLLAVAVTLIISFQDSLPTFLVDFVKEYVFSTQKHIRLRLELLNLGGIADLMRDGLKALGLLWLVVTLLTLGATFLTRYIWQRRTRKKTEADAKLGGKLAPGEVLVPLHDPLMLEMDDEFSRFVHRYAFYLDLRCRSAEDATRAVQAMDTLKATLSTELVTLAEGRMVQVRREEAISALSKAANRVTTGGVVGIILRTSDYHRLRKPESAVTPAAAGSGPPKVKMSTSWGPKPYQEIVAAGPEVAADAGPTSAPAEASQVHAEAMSDAPGGPPQTAEAGPAPAIATQKVRDVLAGLRG
jgi:preprotein translocase subunit YajC